MLPVLGIAMRLSECSWMKVDFILNAALAKSTFFKGEVGHLLPRNIWIDYR